MDSSAVTAHLEASVARQLRLASEDPAVEAAGEALLAALGPAVRQAAHDLAEQAAVEVAAQLPGYDVDVVLGDGEPSLRVRREEPEVALTGDELEARMTVRLPTMLKGLIEDAAGEAGDSVNAFVVRALAGEAKRSAKVGRRMRGTVET